MEGTLLKKNSGFSIGNPWKSRYFKVLEATGLGIYIYIHLPHVTQYIYIYIA